MSVGLMDADVVSMVRPANDNDGRGVKAVMGKACLSPQSV